MSAWKFVPGLVVVAILGSVACGDGGGGGVAAPTAPGVRPGSPQGVPSAAPTGSPTASGPDVELVRQLGDLKPLLLSSGDLPGLRLRSDQPASKTAAAAALSAVPKLSTYLAQSDFEGAWVKLYSRENPVAGLSSVVFEFATPQGAAGYIDTLAGLGSPDYPVASSVELVQADDVGERSSLVRYRFTDSRTLEYTWQQGRLAGQVLLRYQGDVEQPDDARYLVSLARKQAEYMQSFAQ